MIVTQRPAPPLAPLGIVALLCLAFGCTGCGGSKPAAPAEQAPAAAAPAKPPEPAEEPLPPSPLETALPEGVRSIVGKPFFGDFDEMVQRRMIRVGVTYNRTFYFVDKGVQRGLAYEYCTLFENELNKKFNTGNIKIHLVFLPGARDQLLSGLIEGKVDVVVAQLTVTPERQKLVDFTIPTRKGVNEVVVTGPGAPDIASVEDLSGKAVFARKSSSYYQSLLALNEKFKAGGKPPMDLREAPENLDDDDLLEMVNAGLIPAIVVDNYLAEFWKKVFPGLNVHDTVALRTGGNLAVAFRKNSPQLAAALNDFITKVNLNTAMRDMLQKRYLVSTKYAKNAASEAERKRFLELIELFRKYGDKYQMDFLLMAAQGFQESALNQNAKSPVGAIGVMQIMPATGKDLNVGDIEQLEPNIQGGVKYMRFMMDQFYKNEPMNDLNKGLFTFASYNAGPGKIRQLRREAEKRGLDPNVWFGNVEQIASERIGRETVTYVANIYKYYIAYKLVLEEKNRTDAAKAALTKGAEKK